MAAEAVGPDAWAALGTAGRALREQRWTTALQILADVPDSADPATMTRRAAYRAQALESLGRLHDAERSAAEAVRWAKREPGTPGLAVLRGLHAAILGRVAAALSAERAHQEDVALAERSDATLLSEPEANANLIRKANALVDLGRVPAAIETATLVWQRIDASPRERVLAALTLARCGPPEPWVLSAHRVADASDDQNLLTAVAKAAKSSGVILPLLG